MVRKHVSIGQRRHSSLNGGVSHLVDRYFAMSTQVSLGIPQTIYVERQPDLQMYPHTLLINAVVPNMVFIQDFRKDSICITAGCGDIDAHAFWNNGAGNRFDIEEIGVSTLIRIIGQYRGVVPDGLHIGTQYTISFTLIGPSQFPNI